MEVGVAFYFAGKQVAVLDEVHWGIRPAFTIAAYVWCLCTTQSKFNWIVVLTTPMCYYNGVSSEDTFVVNRVPRFVCAMMRKSRAMDVTLVMRS